MTVNIGLITSEALVLGCDSVASTSKPFLDPMSLGSWTPTVSPYKRTENTRSSLGISVRLPGDATTGPYESDDRSQGDQTSPRRFDTHFSLALILAGQSLRLNLPLPKFPPYANAHADPTSR